MNEKTETTWRIEFKGNAKAKKWSKHSNWREIEDAAHEVTFCRRTWPKYSWQAVEITTTTTEKVLDV